MNSSITIGKMKYTVSLSVSGLNHLCTFKEVSEFKLSVSKKSDRFDSFMDHDDDLTPDELNLVSAMFGKLCTDSGAVSSDVKGFLVSISTGNDFRWDYTRKQNKMWMPVINNIEADTSMPLYRDDKGGGKYVELTMFNFNRSKLTNLGRNLESYKSVLQSVLPPVIEPVNTELTEEAIREYLQGI